MTCRIFRLVLPLSLLLASRAAAHVGSPDIYLDGRAGPYQLFVTVRPPTVIPGVAELEVRTAASGIEVMRAVPLPMLGPGAKFAPVADKLVRSPEDPQLFTGSLWMMAPGSWQVQVTASGARGNGVLAIPVPAAATATERMQPGLGAVLGLLGLLLVAGLIAMAGAAVREARLPPGAMPDARRQRAGRIAMAVAACLVGAVLWGGARWWSSEAESYGREVYRPLRMSAAVTDGSTLALHLEDPGWLSGPEWRVLFRRSTDDFIPDHNHLMHLYALREPGLDTVYHLHPTLAGPGLFEMQLPSMLAGKYRLYADVVHANGFPETLVSALNLNRPVAGRAPGPDEAVGYGPAWKSALTDERKFDLPDGYQMVWLDKRVATSLTARKPMLLRFQLVAPGGSAPADMALYMGMPGHAAIVKTDGSVFAHIHPSGTVSMAALSLAQGNESNAGEMPGMSMPGMDMSGMQHAAHSPAVLPDTVAFPYGFPSPGRYRIFVQMKHGNTIETGIFDAAVT